MSFAFFGFVLGIIIVLVVAFILKKVLVLLANSLIGFFALYAVKWLFFPTLVTSFWSVLITAIGGIVGFILVLILHLTGIAF